MATVIPRGFMNVLPTMQKKDALGYKFRCSTGKTTYNLIYILSMRLYPGVFHGGRPGDCNRKINLNAVKFVSLWVCLDFEVLLYF